MGNQASALGAKCCTPVCCAMCLHEDTLKDTSAGSESNAFANAASALGGGDAAAEEIALDDSLEKELAQEVELWRLENAGPADGSPGAVFGISARPLRDAAIFKPEPAAAARWAGAGVAGASQGAASWPGFGPEPESVEPAPAASTWPPPVRRLPDAKENGGQRGAWTEAAAKNLDARVDRAGPNRSPRQTHSPPLRHSQDQSSADALSSSDEDGFVGFIEEDVGPDDGGGRLPKTMPQRSGLRRSVF